MSVPPWQTPPPPQDPFSPEPDPRPVPLPPAYSGPPAPLYPTTPVPYPPSAMPYVGYGVDPLTGQPLSDKSKVAAGLLQLLPGFCLSVGGIGRLYAGQSTLGTVQLVSSLIAWTMLLCGFFSFFLTWIVAFGIWLWFVVDGILLLAGRPVDGQGRLLRP